MNTHIFGKKKKVSRGGSGMCRMLVMRFILCISLLAVPLTVPFAALAAPASGAVTLDGYLLTSCCYFGSTGSPAAHGLGCLKMPSCAHTGYGIAVLNSTGEYDFYFFDGTVYPAASGDPAVSGGQALARNLVETSSKSNHIAIQVSGTLTDDVRTQTLHDGTSGADFRVITVQGITEAAAITPVAADLTGYIIDEDCFTGNADPGSDGIMCLTMPGCAASGYGTAVLEADGTYSFAYFDGTFSTKAGILPTGGQLLAANLLITAKAQDHVTIHITGQYTGEKTKNTAGTNNGLLYPVVKVSELTETSAPAAVLPSSTAAATQAAAVAAVTPAVQAGSTVTSGQIAGIQKTGEKETRIMTAAGVVLTAAAAGVFIYVLKRRNQSDS